MVDAVPGFVTAMTESEVVVHGSGFQNTSSLHCIFDGRDAVKTVFIDAKTLLCVTPASLTRGVANLRVSIDDYVTETAVDITVMRKGRISRLEPRNGPLTGGTVVRIIGSHFLSSSNLRCNFGELPPVKAVYVDVGELQCSAPPSSVLGAMDVVLTLSGLAVSESGPQYTYTTMPLISHVMPSAIAVGSTMVIRGNNFSPDMSLFCRVGAASPVRAEYLNASAVACVCPEVPMGANVVTASNNGFDFALSSVAVWVTSGPDITDLSPRSGSAFGGTVLQFSGSNFFQGIAVNSSAVALCRFDFASVEKTEIIDGLPKLSHQKVVLRDAVIHSPTSVSCKTPGHADGGLATVELSLNGGAILPNGYTFEYEIPPTLLSMAPILGGRSGGTRLSCMAKGLRCE